MIFSALTLRYRTTSCARPFIDRSLASIPDYGMNS